MGVCPTCICCKLRFQAFVVLGFRNMVAKSSPLGLVPQCRQERAENTGIVRGSCVPLVSYVSGLCYLSCAFL